MYGCKQCDIPLCRKGGSVDSDRYTPHSKDPTALARKGIQISRGASGEALRDRSRYTTILSLQLNLWGSTGFLASGDPSFVDEVIIRNIGSS